MARITKAQRDESRDSLTSEDSYNLKPGDTIYTSHHAPATYLRLFVIRENRATGQPYPANITWHVANVTGLTPKNKDGAWYLRNTVIGMDRGFDVVYQLSMTLFGDGYALKHAWL